MSVPRALSTISRPTLTRTAAPLLRSAATQPQRRSYHEKVLDHYSNPRNVGSMDKSLSDVGTGKSEPSAMQIHLGFRKDSHNFLSQASSVPLLAAT
jgi:hypothetical protein